MTVLSHPPLVFVLPTGSDAPSGGNIYNRELTRSLVQVLPIGVMNFAEAERSLSAGKPGVYFFDTLDLDKTTSLNARRADQLLGLIVHHLPSLEPDAAPGDVRVTVETQALSRFDLFLATSEFTRDYLTRRGHFASVILTVPPALPRVVSRNRSYKRPLSALMVANIVPRKAVLSFIEALAEIGPTTSHYVLRIVGRDDIDAAYAEACRRALRTASWLADSIHIESPVPHEQMGDLYESADLSVSASTMETFGMAIQEARAHGLPILAQDGGYTRHHFTDGENGRLFSSTVELARGLLSLAGDEHQMSELFLRAQRTRLAHDYTWAVAAHDFLGELDTALKSVSKCPSRERLDRSSKRTPYGSGSASVKTKLTGER